MKYTTKRNKKFTKINWVKYNMKLENKMVFLKQYNFNISKYYTT